MARADLAAEGQKGNRLCSIDAKILAVLLTKFRSDALPNTAMSHAFLRVLVRVAGTRHFNKSKIVLPTGIADIGEHARVLRALGLLDRRSTAMIIIYDDGRMAEIIIIDGAEVPDEMDLVRVMDGITAARIIRIQTAKEIPPPRFDQEGGGQSQRKGGQYGH